MRVVRRDRDIYVKKTLETCEIIRLMYHRFSVIPKSQKKASGQISAVVVGKNYHKKILNDQWCYFFHR